MTGEELLQELQNMTPEQRAKRILFGYNYGDRTGSIVASDISEVAEVKTAYSAYHNMFKVSRKLYADEDYEDVLLLHDEGVIEQEQGGE